MPSILDRERELLRLAERDHGALVELYRRICAGAPAAESRTVSQLVAAILDVEFPHASSPQEVVRAKYPEAIASRRKPSLIASEQWWIAKTRHAQDGYLAQAAATEADAWAMAAAAIRSGTDEESTAPTTPTSRSQRASRLPLARKRLPLTRPKPGAS